MTVDEIMRAGGTSSNNLTSPYAWYYLNSSGESITGASSFWLLSPRGWYDSHANAFSVMGSPGPGALNYNDLSFTLAVRPTISLKSCIKYGIGDGSATNPYTILETESGC